MDYNIYTLGDIDFVWSAFNGIALIFSQHTGVREFMTTAAVLAAVNLFYKSWLWVLNPLKNEVPIFSWLLGLVLFSIAITRVDVTIESVKTGEVRAVDGVPIFIAASATLTTNLSQGLLRDYKIAFDPLSPIDMNASSLNDDITLGPMVKFVKFMQWGGDSQGYCSQFPSPDASIGTLNLCKTIQSIAMDCLKSSQNSTATIVGKENIFNDIYSSDLAESLAAISSAISTGNKNASARLVGTNGSKTKPCADVWSDVLSIKDRPETVSLMQTIAQVNGIMTPDDVTGANSGLDFTAAMKAANGIYSQAIGSHDVMMGNFVLNSLSVGEQLYKSGLGSAAGMQLFEAQVKRTNSMVSQGQLWLQLSGAAISFLEMFSYMVAPFALLMLIALGGNGVGAAAKYLQLIIFVNMWPITAVLVNAYIKKVLTADLDTWSTLNSQNSVVTWMGQPGLYETYSSYLSVASGLYALIPVLTLFLMTQSIHPMMNATKGVTPDAPVNNGHLTPQVWSSPDAGKSSFGDVQQVADVSTGRGMGTSGGFSSYTAPRVGTWATGEASQQAQGMSATQSHSQLKSDTQSFNQSMSNLREQMASGSTNSQSSQTMANTMSMVEKLSSQVANAVSKDTSLGQEQVKGMVSQIALQGALSAGTDGMKSMLGSLVSGKGTINSLLQSSDTNQQKLGQSLKDAFTNTLSNNSGLDEGITKGMSSLKSSGYLESNSMKEAFGSVMQSGQSLINSATAAVSTEGKMSSSSGMDYKQTVNLDNVSDSLKQSKFTDDAVRDYASKSGLDANAFMDKFNSHFDTFSKSNTMGDDQNRRDALVSTMRDFGNDLMKFDATSGETPAQSQQDFRQSQALLQNLVTDFGANEQMLSPAIRQMAAMAGDATPANFIANTQGQQSPVNTSNVPTQGQVQSGGQAISGNVENGMAGQRAEASQTPQGTVNGVSAAGLTRESGSAAVTGVHSENQKAVMSPSERAALSQADEKGVPMTTAKVDKLAAENQNLSGKQAVFTEAGNAAFGATPPQIVTGPVRETMAALKVGNDLFGDADKEVNRIQNSDMTPEQKRTELGVRAAANLHLANNQDGSERNESRHNAEVYRNALKDEGVNWSMDQIQNMSRQASGYNKGATSLDDVVNANLGTPSVSSQAKTVLPGSAPVATDIDRNAADTLIRNTQNSGGVVNTAGAALMTGKQFVANTMNDAGLGGSLRAFEGWGMINTPQSTITENLQAGAIPNDLGGKVSAMMIVNDAVQTNEGNPALASGALDRHELQLSTINQAIYQQMSDSKEFGPEKAEEFRNFAQSNLNDSSLSYGERSDRYNNWVNENRSSK
ncbi:TraG-like protein, N-terminal region [Buttiauxella agrestis]|uniref:TraG-like protein, N-terminal region n=1 Tax=Buttiauxella agrestis TaxID=82977 RepID=A0A381KNM5_9ENTR|nr:conjugal transfer protein TraG N-terminal domain-containing protein [Buttiauxella agrestis]SUY92898.1 TraG-like protein, N-terminal region [Buttiauxella agrestis]